MMTMTMTTNMMVIMIHECHSTQSGRIVYVRSRLTSMFSSTLGGEHLVSTLERFDFLLSLRHTLFVAHMHLQATGLQCLVVLVGLCQFCFNIDQVLVYSAALELSLIVVETCFCFGVVFLLCVCLGISHEGVVLSNGLLLGCLCVRLQSLE